MIGEFLAAYDLRLHCRTGLRARKTRSKIRFYPVQFLTREKTTRSQQWQRRQWRWWRERCRRFLFFGSFSSFEHCVISYSCFCLASFLIVGRGDESYRSIATTGEASSRNKWPRSEEVKLLFRRLTALLRYPSLGKTSKTLKRSNVRRQVGG